MDYQKIYSMLIEDAKTNPKDDDYKETHHIIPLCMFGPDDYTNQVKLTARQHFLAHWLLYKIYRTSKLVHAWHGMCRIGKGQDARRQSSHLYQYAKKERSRILSESSMGEKNWFSGKNHTKESMDKMIVSRERTYKEYPERRIAAKKAQGEGASRKWKGVPKSKESNVKRARPNLVTLKHATTGECVRIDRKEAMMYDKTIWKNPYSLREKKYGICPHCGKEGELSSTFKRWHLDNCKEKV